MGGDRTEEVGQLMLWTLLSFFERQPGQAKIASSINVSPGFMGAESVETRNRRGNLTVRQFVSKFVRWLLQDG